MRLPSKKSKVIGVLEIMDSNPLLPHRIVNSPRLVGETKVFPVLRVRSLSKHLFCPTYSCSLVCLCKFNLPWPYYPSISKGPKSSSDSCISIARKLWGKKEPDISP